jgi:ribosome biogenesis protein Nip4
MRNDTKLKKLGQYFKKREKSDIWRKETIKKLIMIQTISKIWLKFPQKNEFLFSYDFLS